MSPGVLSSNAQPGVLLDQLSSTPHAFLTPPLTLHQGALAEAKQFLDPLASSTSHSQEARVDASRRKRKRGANLDNDSARDILRLKTVHLNGFPIDGIWGQARRILEASTSELERAVKYRTRGQRAITGAQEVDKPVRTIRIDDEGFEIDSDEEGEELEHTTRLSNSSEPTTIPVRREDDQGSVSSIDEEEEETEENIEDASDLDVDTDDEGFDGTNTFTKDKHGLNDGFFDIDDFNKESEFFEQAGGREEDDIDSDEEEVDYFADPSAKLGADIRRSSRHRQKGDEVGGNEDDDDDEGPTFGNADLNAPWSDDEDNDDNLVELDADVDDMADDAANANEIRYNDFFDPPPQPLLKTKRRRALPKTQPSEADAKPLDQDVQRTIDSVRRDIFEDDFSDADATPDEDGNQTGAGQRNLSSHEKRKLSLAKQIRELEAAAIEKRQWQLSGEASASARPENALLEEDLEFERAGKPIAVITSEVSSSIEDMIKRRILDRQFDEVIKRLPGSTERGQPRRGLLELSDKKDPASLAESYEQSYLAQTDPNAKDPRSEALKAQHAEVERLWSEVSDKLDALTSWRYKPRPASVEVKVITDAPKILMEDARPNGVEGIQGEESGLAPQEIFQVGQDGKSGQDGIVTTKGGAVISKEELTREDKLRRRRREKERTKKRDTTASKVPGPTKADAVPSKALRDDETSVLKQLKVGGVKVIGKGGELRDVEGKAVQKKGASGASKFKL